ncbi:hypothetical protein ORJ66_20535 [Pseudoalteromonas tunicata]|uniref:hypothetical protein n=1 Tax=Pseudoalteromonas tunicata TaxID=314281 RepID=UPI00273DB2D3|nr:hypothetical protein [Pseudoalteromonas tunicata]MDP5215439.1 hypothetical protein [Pseudoalteromonas tunicata]
MSVILTQNGAIPNIFQGSPNSLNNERKEAVYNVIGKLKYHQIFQKRSWYLGF